MEQYLLQSRCVGRVLIAGLASLSLLTLSGCATTVTVNATPQATSAAAAPPADDDDFSLLIAQLRQDLNLAKARETAQPKSASAKPGRAADQPKDREFADRAKALFSKLDSRTLVMPVVGVRTSQLYNSWGDARDGGRRRHRGIDIFAPKGTPLVAVADGIISYIGVQPKGGNCLWLTTESGSSFYYAHLDRWAPGLYEGMEVKSGDLLGFVGNTGNALTTPPHLHFGINEDDEMVNPYPILTKATVVKTARNAQPNYGGGFGTK
jgi:murein DD-endopeptidase MepM/ murein hydrolase activator NlpD